MNDSQHHPTAIPRMPLGALLALFVSCGQGCSRPQQPDAPRPQPASGPVAEAPAEPAGGAPVDSAAPSADPQMPQRPRPAGKPSPSAVCGHAVAFAGWKPSDKAARDTLLICDPGDNALEARDHSWQGTPREIPVHYGKQRPTIVLQPAGGFTITGAVVIVPTTGLPEAEAQPVTAEGMPDLSQDFNPAWPGLCGPTAAADLLYAMGHHRPGILTDFRRGPGAEADADAARMIAGDGEAITPQSLAGRMGVGPGGAGATNTGMAEGLRRWLATVDPGEWRVDLEWFDDKPRDRVEQQAFLGRLAAAVEAGGGGIVCLWPGTAYADAPVSADGGSDSGGPPMAADAPEQRAEAAVETALPPAAAEETRSGGRREQRAEQASMPPLPEAGFPALPPVSERRGGLPGRAATRSHEELRRDGTRKLDAARRQLENGRVEAAYQTATAAVALLHQAAKLDPESRPQLTEAISLCAECGRRLPSRRQPDRNEATLYE